MFWIVGGPGIFYALETLVDAPILRLIVRQFDHSSWNGFTFWDLIFPLFLFIVDIAMPFSFARRIERGDSRKMLDLHVVKRAITLFFLGLICNGGFSRPISELRVPGVLQRIALCYFFASIVTLNMGIRRQVITAVSLLVFYWAAMKLVPVHG